MHLYQIDTGYSCFILEVENMQIINAPSIAKWTLGKNWGDVKTYYTTKKNANIKKMRV